jgi:integrase
LSILVFDDKMGCIYLNEAVIGRRDWLDALDGSDFWDSSSIDPIGLGALFTSLSGSVGRTSCDTPTSQSTASGRILCLSLYEVRDRAEAKHKRSFANLLIDVLRLLFSWAKKRDLMDKNPALTVDRRPKDAKVVNCPWREEELEIVLARASRQIRLAVAIAAYTGLRESDVVRVNLDVLRRRCVRDPADQDGRSRLGQRAFSVA